MRNRKKKKMENELAEIKKSKLENEEQKNK